MAQITRPVGAVGGGMVMATAQITLPLFGIPTATIRARIVKHIVSRECPDECPHKALAGAAKCGYVVGELPCAHPVYRVLVNYDA